MGRGNDLDIGRRGHENHIVRAHIGEDGSDRDAVKGARGATTGIVSESC
jgi:hypothetical protein